MNRQTSGAHINDRGLGRFQLRGSKLDFIRRGFEHLRCLTLTSDKFTKHFLILMMKYGLFCTQSQKHYNPPDMSLDRVEYLKDGTSFFILTFYVIIISYSLFTFHTVYATYFFKVESLSGLAFGRRKLLYFSSILH